MTLLSVGSYQVGYTRSHPNTEVKMLRACSVPLCSHRWERQVIYLFIFFGFFLIFAVSYSTCPGVVRFLFYTRTYWPLVLYMYRSVLILPDLCLSSFCPSFFLVKKTSLAGVEPAIFRFVVWRVSIAPQALTTLYYSYLSISFCGLLPWLALSDFTIGRFISSRIHPFPSEHGSKDA